MKGCEDILLEISMRTPTLSVLRKVKPVSTLSDFGLQNFSIIMQEKHNYIVGSRAEGHKRTRRINFPPVDHRSVCHLILLLNNAAGIPTPK